MVEILATLLQEGRIKDEIPDIRAKPGDATDTASASLEWRMETAVPAEEGASLSSLPLDQFFVWLPGGEAFQRSWARKPDFLLVQVSSERWSPSSLALAKQPLDLPLVVAVNVSHIPNQTLFFNFTSFQLPDLTSGS